MFSHNKDLLLPPDLNAKIWRYTDLAKLLSLLERQALFFCRMDRLSDPFEGSYPQLNVQARKEALEQILSDQSSDARERATLSEKAMELYFEYQRKCTAVSCWHLSEWESAAMWQLYLSGDEGIAIQSTCQRLIDAVSADPERVFIGLVRYLDYDKEAVPDGNLLVPLSCKRKSFEHEKELRGMVWKPGSGKPGPIDFSSSAWEYGLYVKVDVPRLIERIHLAPTAPKWMYEMLSSVLKRYPFDIEVKQSDLDKTPVY